MTRTQTPSLIATASALALSLGKFGVSLLSGSLAVAASGLDSLLDTFMSAMNFFAIRKAEQPADEEHEYGHGKIEPIAASIQAVIILFSGGFLIYEAVKKFMDGTDIQYSGLDMGMMVASLVASFFISRMLGRAGKRTGSSVLKADALHYTSDLYSNSAAIAAIIITYFTGITSFDLVFAVVTGVIIIVSALKIARDGFSNLMDVRVPDGVREEIESVLAALPYPYAGFHKLRTRSSGTRRYIDFHLLACRRLTLDDAHELSNRVEREIASRVAPVDVLTHVEPCPYPCELTEGSCRLPREEARKPPNPGEQP